MKYFSMFSGIGGFELGIQQATDKGYREYLSSEPARSRKCLQSTGNKSDNQVQWPETEQQEYSSKSDAWECVGFSEIDKYAIATYQAHFPSHKNFGDAKQINPNELPDFDLLVGGFPCQSFSIAGKRKGFQDTRGTLFHEIVRIAKVKKPRTLLLENVKGLLSADDGRCFATIISSLDELGYDVEWQVLNSKYFGVPQNRERVFIAGHLRGTGSRQIFPLEGSYTESCESPGETRAEKERLWDYPANTISQRDYKGGNQLVFDEGQARGEIMTMLDVGQAYRISDTTGISPTIPTPSGGNHMPKIAIPVLTPDRVNKRQNGRRFKEDGEPSFTVTGQDIHGVMIQSHSPRCGDPSRGGTGPLESSEHCFTVDSTPHLVKTDALVFDDYNHKVKVDGIVGSVRPTFNNEAEGNGCKLIQENKIRRLTPTECERLQGFYDGWTLGSDTQRYKQCGNAVTVNVIREIVKEMLKVGV